MLFNMSMRELIKAELERLDFDTQCLSCGWVGHHSEVTCYPSEDDPMIPESCHCPECGKEDTACWPEY